MEDLWHSRQPPEPLDLDALLGSNGDAAPAASAAAAGGSACKALGLTDTHAVWDVPQNARLFLAAVQAFLDQRPDELGAAQVCGHEGAHLIPARLGGRAVTALALARPLPTCLPAPPFHPSDGSFPPVLSSPASV